MIELRARVSESVGESRARIAAALLDRATDGGVVLVTGLPGAGVTGMLRRVAAAAESRGRTVGVSPSTTWSARCRSPASNGSPSRILRCG